MQNESPETGGDESRDDALQELESQRRELANVLGRLLARAWLRGRFDDPHDSHGADRDADAPAEDG